MAITAKIEQPYRWVLTLRTHDSFSEDLGSVGEWVGPRIGPRKRDQEQKEEFVLHRLLVAWRDAGALSFPVEVRAVDRRLQGSWRLPDFVLQQGAGGDIGLEVTEAGEERHQRWMTKLERSRGAQHVPDEDDDLSTTRTVDEFKRAIASKSKVLNEGSYGGVGQCDLVVYDNTHSGGFLDKPDILDELRRSNELGGQFRQVHLVFASMVFVNVFGDSPRRVEIGWDYEMDYVQWLESQARLLRKGATDGLDRANLAEELESLARKDRRELGNHLRVLLLHLLKCQFHAGPKREEPIRGWSLSMRNARRSIDALLSDSPSLKAEIERQLTDVYHAAREDAATELDVPVDTHPLACPYTSEQMRDLNFMPVVGRAEMATSQNTKAKGKKPLRKVNLRPSTAPALPKRYTATSMRKVRPGKKK
ncbi:MAG: DUF29 domain-containing protein [Alphaproteobacteria bacterium]